MPSETREAIASQVVESYQEESRLVHEAAEGNWRVYQDQPAESALHGQKDREK